MPDRFLFPYLRLKEIRSRNPFLLHSAVPIQKIRLDEGANGSNSVRMPRDACCHLKYTHAAVVCVGVFGDEAAC